MLMNAAAIVCFAVMIGAMAAVTIYTKDDGKKDKKE